MMTNSATTTSAISAGVTGAPSVGGGRQPILPVSIRNRHVSPRDSLQSVAHDRSRTLNVEDAHGVPDRERLAAVLGACGPLVGAQLDPPAVRVDRPRHLG